MEHPTFRRVINLACRARNGVKIPSRKATRKELIDMLNKYFLDLAERLKVRILLCKCTFGILKLTVCL